MLTPKLELIIAGGNVKRFHTVPTIKDDLVSSHSYMVAWLVTLISRNPSSQLLIACLQHDIAESVVGDIPSPSKRAFSLNTTELEQKVLQRSHHVDYAALLTKEEKRLLKVCDILAGLLFCVQERKFGNRHVDVSFNNYRSYIEEFQPLSSDETEILLWIDSQ